jgi:hypothetical protein
VVALIVTDRKSVITGLVAAIIVILSFLYVCPIVRTQSASTFMPTDVLSIPEYNGTIRFGVNGSYAAATLQNGTWVFDDLRLRDSPRTGNLRVSAENCNITIWSYRAFDFAFGRTFSLRYLVEGQGKQTVNLGLNSSKPTHASEWSVVVPGNIFLAEGEGWNLLPDDTVVVYGLMGNVSIAHYGFSTPSDSNLPFYQQHSVAIITAAVVAVTVAVSVIIKVKLRS